MKVADMKYKIFGCIVEYINENGFPPSIRELNKMTGLKSTSSIWRYLDMLEKENTIQIKREVSRGIKVVA